MSKTKQQILREIDVLTQLRHENLIRFEGAYASNNYLYIVLELATGGELFDKIVENSYVRHARSYDFLTPQIPEPEARKLFQQLLNAVKYLHGKGIVHRDLKVDQQCW